MERAEEVCPPTTFLSAHTLPSEESSADNLEPPCKVSKFDVDDEENKLQEARLKTMQTLVGVGCIVDIEDDDGLTPLFHAVRRNDIPVVRELVSVGADVNYASVADNLFLGGGALHQAAAKSSPEMVKELLDLGAHINLEDHFGKTALHWAAWEGRLETLKLLVERGGDLTVEDSWDRTLLHMAADGGHADVAAWLLQQGADPKATCSEDNTPLHYAAVGGHTEVMKILIPHISPDARDILGRTPLMCAVRYGRVEAVRLLLKAGATPRNKDDFGVSVLDWTADLDSPEILEILCRAINGDEID